MPARPRPAAFVLLALALLAATGHAGDAPEWTIPPDMRAALPPTAVVRVGEATGLRLDGALDEPAWAQATPYTTLERNDGQGVLDFPTTVRLLRCDGDLWIGIDAVVPPTKDGRDRAAALAEDRLELWLDNAATRSSCYQAFIDPHTGGVDAPGLTADEAKQALATAVAMRPDGYSLEIRVARDRLRAFGPPDPATLGFDLARSCAGGRWATLVGLIGPPHRPETFWQLDLTGAAPAVAQEPSYRSDPFVAGSDVRALAHDLVAAWPGCGDRDDRAAGRMEVIVARLRALLDADAADAWGFAPRIAAVLWVASEASAPVAIDDAPAWTDACRRLAAARAPGQPFRASPWREEVYRSDADGAWQPYALRVPSSWDGRVPLPLVVFLHGSSRGDDGEGAVFDPFEGDDRFLMVKPAARHCDEYRDLARRDVLDVIADIRRRFAVDGRRIVVMGYSAGGFAALDLATEDPERFAAIASASAALRPGLEDGLRTVPTLIVHGLADPVVPYGWRTGLNAVALAGAGCPVALRLLPATGHGPALTGITDWLLRAPTIATPDELTCRIDGEDGRPRRNRWLGLLATAGHGAAAIHARIAGDALNAVTGNVRVCGFDLDGAGTRPETLVIDGTTLRAPSTRYARVVATHAGWTIEAAEAFPTPDPTAHADGGVDTVYRAGPLLIVYGTGLEDAAKKLASYSPDGTNPLTRIPMVAADAVTPAQLAANNLIVVGDAASNRVAAAIAARTWTPTRDADQFTLAPPARGGEKPEPKTFACDRYAYSLVTRNPDAPERRAWLIAVPSAAALDRRSAILRWRHDGAWPDLVVVDTTNGSVAAAWTLEDDWAP